MGTVFSQRNDPPTSIRTQQQHQKPVWSDVAVASRGGVRPENKPTKRMQTSHNGNDTSAQPPTKKLKTAEKAREPISIAKFEKLLNKKWKFTNPKTKQLFEGSNRQGHGLVLKDGYLFCTYCDCEVNRAGLNQHLATKKHMAIRDRLQMTVKNSERAASSAQKPTKSESVLAAAPRTKTTKKPSESRSASERKDEKPAESQNGSATKTESPGEPGGSAAGSGKPRMGKPISKETFEKILSEPWSFKSQRHGVFQGTNKYGQGLILKDDGFIFCTICQTDVPRYTINRHICTQSHIHWSERERSEDKKTESETEPGVTVKLKLISEEQFERILSTPWRYTRPATREVFSGENKRGQGLKLENGAIICTFCQCLVPKKSVSQHISSKKHQQLYESSKYMASIAGSSEITSEVKKTAYTVDRQNRKFGISKTEFEAILSSPWEYTDPDTKQCSSGKNMRGQGLTLENGVIFCSLCDCNVSNTAIAEHLGNAKHLRSRSFLTSLGAG